MDVHTKIGKAILVKINNVMAMAYMTQCLSSMAMLNAIFNVQAEAGWPTGGACQLLDNLKHRCNPNEKLSRAQMIKKLHEIKPKKEKIPRQC